ncbi:BTAD domain-containing putative transcriptional regulator [Phytohabitans sp. ZYX-F-186]|uniref:BTAD domain-containing putative transcriptional regulator n=1 Tax=Phytohabitans maris TaxID=3071409 RepID=A0ABU0ZDE6_9ACTN|nr:BTAD domain-containing putative transcriptional regulator [Phytohabitans sp. ZYX-F-186]MDQ7905081.1 BTAD domain-containing putative transcriptional regulator [Phytohabitans sp. ZYX-F-186]
MTARRGPAELELGSPQQRAVLAALLLQAGVPVSIQQLMETLWDDGAPRSAEATIRTYVYRLRRVLTPDGAAPPVIRSAGAGYLVDVRPEELDLATFRQLVGAAEAARREADTTGAADLLRRGLALWNGEPLAGLPGQPMERYRANLAKLRLNALEALLAAEIDLGAYVSAGDQLASLVAEHPLDERFRRLLMLALWRSGQQAEALAVYQDARDTLAAELGVDPGPELQALHLRILRAESPAPPVPTQRVAAPAQTRTAARGRTALATPAQLPADLPDFVGRTAELAGLDALLPAGDAPPPAMLISSIHGMAGTGKTALAVHWGHRIAGRFPDGQLYLNLRGFHPTGVVMSPLEALRAVFDAIGVDPRQLPDGLDAQAALYRSLMAGRRMLLLLDNARDADQVRPLLPGSRGCLVIVTSRHQMPSLVAIEQARPTKLCVLPDDDARAYLRSRLGSRVGPDDGAQVDTIVRLCGGLPLALSLVAARSALNPHSPVAAVADQLSADHGTLDSFVDNDPAIDLKTIFSWSYERVSPSAARLLRLLALHPGPDAAPASVASLAGAPLRQVRAGLDELVHASLAREPSPGRYVLHDLVRAYAAERAQDTDPEPERRAAVARLLEHYTRTARAAVQLLDPQWDLDPDPSTIDGVAPVEVADAEAARTWLTVEHRSAVAAVELAAEYELDVQLCRLAATLSDIFQRHGHWRDQVAMQTLALGAGRRVGDLGVRAAAHRSLGSAYARLNQLDAAQEHLLSSLELFEAVGDRANQGRSHRGLAYLHGQQGRYDLALAASQRALELYRAAGDPAGVASALNDTGWCHAMLGDFAQALTHCRQALDALSALDVANAVASTWDSLGFIHAGLGERREAVAAYTRAVEMFHELGDRYNEADALVHLGDCHRDLGDLGAARGAWRRALALLDLLGHATAREVRTRLDQVAREGLVSP